MEEMDDLKSQFLSMLKDKGIKHRVQGSPEQERQRTKDMIAQRDTPSKPSAPSTSSAYRDGFQDGLRGHRNPRASNIHGPMSNDYDSGYHAGAMKKEKGVAESEKKGLYYYVNKRKKAGTSRDASSPKAPTAQAWKDAAKTAKKEGIAEDSGKRCMQCGMKDCKCPGDSCKCKPIAGWIPGKGFKKAIEEAANAAQQAAIAIAIKKKKSAAEAFNPNSVDAKHAADVKAHHRAELKKKADAGDENAKARLAKAKKNDTDRRAEFDFNMNREGVEEGYGMGGYATAVASQIRPGKGVDKEMPEGDEYNEYDDEVDMVENNLHTIIRACKDLADVLIAGENMPEWVEEKISMAKQNMVTVAEYIQSQHEQGHIYKEAGHPDEKEDKELIRKMVKRAALKQETNDPYMAELHARLAEKIPKNAPVKAYIDDFAKAAKTPNAKGHHQFKNKSPEKVRQMAIAASYGAKNPSKKK